MENKTEQIDISFIAQAITISVAILYVIGFVVVNSYLAKAGIYSFEIINSQYLSAGVLTAFVFAIFAFVVGRRVYFLESDYDEFVKLGFDEKKPIRSFVWAIFCFLYNYIELAFGIVVGVYWTASIFFENVDGSFVLGAFLFGLFAIDYLILWRGGLYEKLPFVTLPLASVGFIAAIYVAYINIHDPRVYFLLVTYVVVVVLLNIVLDTAYIRAKNKSWTIFWATVTILGVAVLFGKSFYGEVKRELGGAKPIIVTLVMSDDTPKSIGKILQINNGMTGEIELYSETQSDLILKVKTNNESGKQNQFLRLNKSLVLGILPKPQSSVKMPSLPLHNEANKTKETNQKPEAAF